jgi:predicted DsbA family dithiol-disulfide isomerase
MTDVLPSTGLPMSERPHVAIRFVSDVACPWCAVGLSALDVALERCAGDLTASLVFEPFELNPSMPAEGQDVGEHLAAKYGSTLEQQTAIRETIRQRGADNGFVFKPEGRGRIYPTFDAHRLLAWVGATLPSHQHDLKMALLVAYHGQGRSPARHDVLLDVVRSVPGLDVDAAARVLAGNAYADEVRAREAQVSQWGIRSVPAVIINDQYLISGGQPADVFEQSLRQIAGLATA